MTDHRSTPPSHGIARRDLLLGMGAAATAAFAGKVAASMPGHDHRKHSPKQGNLLDATFNCLEKGQRCIAHCLVSFQEGDLELADCAAKVHEMQAICDAFSYLLASNSIYTDQYAGVCGQVCKDCAEECRNHDEHFECKACAQACERIVKEIDRVFGKTASTGAG